MTKAKESAETALGALTAEMTKPPIAASALEAMHPESEWQQRKLVPMHQEPFHGYACSWCGCRFPKTDIPADVSLLETLRVSKVQREKRFVAHVCSECPHSTH